MGGAGVESGCWMVWEMVEWRLVASVSELDSGCIVAELALRVPKGGRMSVVGARARCPTLRDSKTQGKWTSTRARGELCANRPQVVQGTCAPTGAARLCPPDALRVIRGRSSGSGETRATELPKPSAAVFTQVRLAANLHPCQSIASRLAIARGICARFPALGGRLALSMRGTFAALCARQRRAMTKRRGRVE